MLIYTSGLLRLNVVFPQWRVRILHDTRSEVQKILSKTVKMDRIQPPPHLELKGNVQENWKRFKQRFELYIQAIGADKKNDAQKIALLLTVAGPETIEVYNTFTYAEGEQGKYSVVIQKLQDYCTPRKNEIYERFVFRSRMQKESETIEQYVTDLKTKSQSCNFGSLCNSLIRDQIVIGIRDTRVKEQLLKKTDLTLEKAIQICQAAELARSQVNSLTNVEQELSVDFVKKKHAAANRKNPSARPQNQSKDVRACMRCGREHVKGKCPAYGKLCNKCSGKNHFAKMCRTKTVHTVQETAKNQEELEFFVGTVRTLAQEDKEWISSLKINGSNIDFKLDTGAQVNILPLNEYDKLANKPAVENKNIVLKTYTGEQIPIQGVCYANVELENKQQKIMFVVVSKNYPPLLGLEAIKQLGLVKRVHVVGEDKTLNTESSEQCEIAQEFAEVFEGIGCLPVTYKIQLKEDAVPVIHPARKIPVALRERLHNELNRMTELGIIKRIEEPTEWVNSLVIVEKKNGDLRLCLDPKDLNQYIKREHHHIPTKSEITSNMANAKFFSKLDASSGFWQIPLDEESAKLCTFNTPHGRYCFLRLPFGISSAPEVFHRTVVQLFEGLDGVKSIHDDIIVWGETETEHDERLRQTLMKAKEVGLKLNLNKCRFRVRDLTFFGDRISDQGIQPDPDKIRAINEMLRPTSKSELQRYLGMVNYLGRFVPCLSAKTKALRSLLEEKNEWQWQSEHEKEWRELNEILTTEPVLQFFDSTRRIKISSDASKDGLGAVLLQEFDEGWKPVAYASRVMTQAEKMYAQIEKELLGITFACDKFHEYVYAVPDVIAETDHKPLVTISKKSFDQTPPRIQRLMLKLQKYSLKIEYTPGKLLVVADTLSRATYPQAECTSTTEEEVQIHVNMVRAYLPVSEEKWKQFADETAKDQEIQNVIRHINNGWSRGPFPKPYYNFRDELTVINGVVLKGQRLVVPSTMRKEMLEKIHEGHQGIEKCKRRGRETLYWPNMNQDVENKVNRCAVCQKYRYQQQREPLKSHEVPNSPWIKVASDLFHLNGKDYLLLIDYYSNYPEFALLANTSSKSVINYMKSIFARHGIPEHVVADNGPQYISQEFQDFATSYGFKLHLRSPYYPQTNGQAEKGVQIVKRLLKKAIENAEDPYLAVLSYRATPLKCGESPAELLMNRKLRTRLPSAKHLTVEPSIRTTQERAKQKHWYDKSSKPLRTLDVGETVRVREDKCWKQKAMVIEETAPRTFKVKTENGQIFVRNRVHLLPTKEEFGRDDSDVRSAGNKTTTKKQSENKSVSSELTVQLRRSQRCLKKPKRLVENI